MSSWQVYTDANGDRIWTLNYLGHFAKVKRNGQAWIARMWPLNDDDPAFPEKNFDHPSKAMASMVLLIESSVREAS